MDAVESVEKAEAAMKEHSMDLSQITEATKKIAELHKDLDRIGSESNSLLSAQAVSRLKMENEELKAKNKAIEKEIQALKGNVAVVDNVDDKKAGKKHGLK